MEPISIVMPCWNRAKYLPLSVESILKQRYPGDVEFIIVENGNDGTKAVAERYGCRYFNVPRDDYPEFQNVPAIWNFGVAHSSHELLLFQNPEIIHKGGNVLADLANRMNEPKSYAVPLVESLGPNGEFVRWFTHPEGNLSFGGGPMLFRKAEFLSFGGWEEGFYGYGYDDNFLFYLLSKHAFTRHYSQEVCAHMDHPRGAYDQTTGYANRALMRLFAFEIERGLREPVANGAPIDFRRCPSDVEISAQIEALRPGSPPIFEKWAAAWKAGDRTPDDDFAVSTYCLNADRESRYLIAETVYSFLRAQPCRQIAREARSQGHLQWADRADLCAKIHETWAAKALGASCANP